MEGFDGLLKILLLILQQHADLLTMMIRKLQ